MKEEQIKEKDTKHEIIKDLRNEFRQKREALQLQKIYLSQSISRVDTLKFAIKGIIGNTPNEIIDKLIEIICELQKERNAQNHYREEIVNLEAEINA